MKHSRDKQSNEGNYKDESNPLRNPLKIFHNSPHYISSPIKPLKIPPVDNFPEDRPPYTEGGPRGNGVGYEISAVENASQSSINPSKSFGSKKYSGNTSRSRTPFSGRIVPKYSG